MSAGPDAAAPPDPAPRRSPVRLALAWLLLIAAMVGCFVAFRVGRPSEHRARQALREGRTEDARRIAEAALRLAPSDQGAAVLLDELDLAVVRKKTTPRERAEAATTAIFRTAQGTTAAREIILADAEAAVARKDPTDLEEQRAGLSRTAGDLDAHLVGLRELIVVERCVKRLELRCAQVFPRAPHEASKSRLDPLRDQYLTHLATVFQDATALLATKPDPTVAGAAYRDQAASAAEHHLLAAPEQRVPAMEKFLTDHDPAIERAREAAARRRLKTPSEAHD